MLVQARNAPALTSQKRVPMAASSVPYGIHRVLSTAHSLYYLCMAPVATYMTETCHSAHRGRAR